MDLHVHDYLLCSFLVAIISGILGPFSYTYYGDLLNALIQTPLNASTVAFVLSMFTLFMGLSAILHSVNGSACHSLQVGLGVVNDV